MASAGSAELGKTGARRAGRAVVAPAPQSKITTNKENKAAVLCATLAIGALRASVAGARAEGSAGAAVVAGDGSAAPGAARVVEVAGSCDATSYINAIYAAATARYRRYCRRHQRSLESKSTCLLEGIEVRKTHSKARAAVPEEVHEP